MENWETCFFIQYLKCKLKPMQQEFRTCSRFSGNESLNSFSMRLWKFSEWDNYIYVNVRKSNFQNTPNHAKINIISLIFLLLSLLDVLFLPKVFCMLQAKSNLVQRGLLLSIARYDIRMACVFKIHHIYNLAIHTLKSGSI